MQRRNTSAVYLEAAEPRRADALLLYGEANFSGAAYFAGCAIESAFWAFVRDGSRMHGRHDLREVYGAGLGKRIDEVYLCKYRGGLLKPTKTSIAFERRDREVSEQLTEAQLRWRNSVRHKSDTAYQNLMTLTPSQYESLQVPDDD